MPSLKSRPIAVCFWFVDTPDTFLYFTICQISRVIDRESLFFAARLMQQVYEICICMMDHCRMRLCFVLDKSLECLLKAMVSAQKHLLILLLYLNSPFFLYESKGFAKIAF